MTEKTERLMKRKSVIERVRPDNEVVGHGLFHMERLADHHIWFGFAGECFDLSAVMGPHGPTIVWQVHSSVWPEETP